MKIALLCGGPSLERGISLNSARSILDHLGGDGTEIVPVYFDQKKRAYKLDTAALYSNTPSDFDFKLSEEKFLSEAGLIKLLKSCDIAFPAMHGAFGDDGGIQSILEKYKIPFIGAPSKVCKLAFDKQTANDFLAEHGFYTLPSIALKIYDKNNKKNLTKFFAEHKLNHVIVKPAAGGSSIGVFEATGVEEALEKAETLFSKRMDTRVVVQPFAKGKEFTVVILQNRFGLPVALPPSEIEVNFGENQIFDFRKKYLPTRQVTYHCPPRFDDPLVEKVQAQAEQLFSLFGFKDFARFDGWVFDDGKIWFADFNPISGMEQQSFLFQQAARIGLTHRDVLLHVVGSSSSRQNIDLRSRKANREKQSRILDLDVLSTGLAMTEASKKPVAVLMGGTTSERQVSLMSGKNVWLKLLRSHEYVPVPYVLENDTTAWKVPYQVLLNHTVEEVLEGAKTFGKDEERYSRYERRARVDLGIEESVNQEIFGKSTPVPLKQLIDQYQFVFIALHGGFGEDGRLQKLLEDKKVLFNGPDSRFCRLAMTKSATIEAINHLQLEGVSGATGVIVTKEELAELGVDKIWLKLKHELNNASIIVKPDGDGCSSGVVRLYSASELKTYIDYLKKGAARIPKGAFKAHSDFVELPTNFPNVFRFEKFIESDNVRITAGGLKYTRISGWVEVTVGVMSDKKGLRVFNPSLTVAEGEVLSVEEKFQGGTGVNLTPPPESIIKAKTLALVKQRIQALSEKLGLNGYSRIDAFINVTTGEVCVLEINTLPALTPSTVLFQQGLAENPAIEPRKLIEMLIENKGY